MNEVVERASEPPDRLPAFLRPLPVEVRARFAHLSQLRLSVHETADCLLVAAGHAPLARGAQPFQRFSLAVNLRNALVHARPERIDSIGTDAPEWDIPKLARRLVGERFPLNPRMVSGLMYPDQLLSAGCAEWAIRAVRDLLDEVHARLGIQRDDWDIPHPDG